MTKFNTVLRTDSYKLTHAPQYPEQTQTVYSYLEARAGAEHDEVVFFGLLPILESIAGRVVTHHDVDLAKWYSKHHFGDDTVFNEKGWRYIVNHHEGRLPVRIKAVPEGTVVPVGNVLMTVENTDPECFWLTNALESLLLHVWYPITVASRSRGVKSLIADYLDRTSDTNRAGLLFMLHDFGYRGTSGDEQAAVGGLAHLTQFQGTDTLVALQLGVETYKADIASLGFSVTATEHSVMTALGREHQFEQAKRIVLNNPSGILSLVADSYDIYEFADWICTEEMKDVVLARDGKLVVRPDSVTPQHPTPDRLVVDLLERLYVAYGGTINSKGFAVLDPHVGLIWGDGIDPRGIEKILGAVTLAGFSVENIVFGMGGGLLQKLDRDTERFAFKSSAQKRAGSWHDVYKEPLGKGKGSKRGRLNLVRDEAGLYSTVRQNQVYDQFDLLQTVFENGEISTFDNFDSIRSRAAL